MAKKNPNNTLLMRLRRTRSHLIKGQASCPEWNDNTVPSCTTCKEIFPRLKEAHFMDCPCHHYSCHYLQRKLTELINKETAKS